MKFINNALYPVVVLMVALLSRDVAADAVVSATVRIGTSNYSGDWYLPTATPKGLVYLQHGFQRNKGHLRALGNSLMAKGMMVLSINAGMTGGAPSLAPQVATALANRTLTPPNGYALPASFVLAGHSAGGLHVTLVGAELANQNVAGFRGVMLFDPVDANRLMATAMQNVVNSGRPVYAILANSGSCNSSNNAEPLLKALTGTSFVGFKLTARSAHTDAEGSSSDFLGRLLCGTPQTYNSGYLQQFAGGWALDLLGNTITGDYYPGGAAWQAIAAANRGYLLKTP